MSENQDNTTFGRLLKIISKSYQVDQEQLRPTASLEELGIDSMSMIDLLFNVEDEFGVTIGREQIELKTVQDIVNYIEKLVADQVPGQVGDSAA